MANPFVHLELTTPDTDRSKEFYGQLFNWSFTDHNMGEGMVYSTFKPVSGPGGGMFTMSGAPNMWLPYVGVENIQKATERAVSLGATILRGPSEVPNVGWFTILADPNGTAIAIWQQTGSM